MDYNEEAEKLNTGTDVWKPELGIHEIVILSEAEETEYVDEKTEKITPQIKLLISIGSRKEDQRIWYIGKGVTTQSLYGQLMLVGQSYGKLTGQKIQLIVNEIKDKNGDKKKSYTIGEAVKILALKNEAKKQQIPSL